MGNIADLLRRSTPDEVRDRTEVKDPLAYLLSNYVDGSVHEWIRGKWGLIFDFTDHFEKLEVFKGWDYQGQYGTPIDDSPSLEAGRIVVKRSFRGAVYGRSLTPQELMNLGYRKIENLYQSTPNAVRQRGIPEDALFIQQLPSRALTFAVDEFGNFIPTSISALSVWELQPKI